jgi:hypothetical protein
MQLRKLSAFVLYLGSYLPLSVILLAQDIDSTAVGRGLCTLSDWQAWNCALPLSHSWLSIGAVLLCTISLLASFAALRLIKPKYRIAITEAKHIPADLINYVIPYVLSFVSLDYSSAQKAIGFAVFFAWIFWLTYRSGQIAMNPVLAGFGWKLYEIKYHYLDSDDAFVGRVLSRTEIEPNQTYRHGSIQDVLIVKGGG